MLVNFMLSHIVPNRFRETKFAGLKPKSALRSLSYDVYNILPLLLRLRRWLSDILRFWFDSRLTWLEKVGRGIAHFERYIIVTFEHDRVLRSNICFST